MSGSTTEWKDTTGRVALKIVKASNYIDYLYLDGAGSTSYQTIRVNLTTISVKTNFACSGVVEYTGSAVVPSSVALPNGRSYTFDYETNSTYTSYKTGRVSKVTLPTGGYIEYLYPGSNNGVSCSDGSAIKLEKEVNDGPKWVFTRSNVNSTTWKTIVTDPILSYDSAANESEHIFTNGRETSHKIFQGSVASGTRLQTIETTWASNGSPASRTVTLEDNQTKSTVSTSYDDYGNLLLASETDWYTGSLPSPVRTTSYSYLSSSAYTSRNIRNRVTQVLLTAGGSTKARTDIAYDESGYINNVNVTGAQQHDDTNYGNSFTYRGLPTSVTTYTNAATPSGGITKRTYYDTLGNVVKADMNCCQQKQFTFSSTTQYSFPDSLTHGPSGGAQLTESTTYNAYTGLPATSTDPNTKTTTYGYDSMKRVTSVQRPDSTTISTTYDDTNRIVRVETPVQGSDKIRQRTYMDNLGRPIKVTVTNASDTQISAAETEYDTLGRPFKQSTPHNSSASYWTETRFDALGRPTVVIPPGASATSGSTRYSYAAKTVTVTDPADKQRKTEVDGLGQLKKVFEPDVASSNALTQETSYAYSALGLLTSVTQGLQTRTYAYDDLGRITSQTTPEAGQWSYQYNSHDLVTQRTDARGVVTSYSYDNLNRLSSVSYNVGSTGVTAAPGVTYTYGTSTSSHNKGRLVTVSDGPGSETYTYDLLGRTTKVDKVISGTTYTTEYEYNLANELKIITYPSGRVVDQEYDSTGRLTKIKNGTTEYVNTFAYNPVGQVTGFNYHNGVAASLTYSADRMQLTALSYVKSSTTLLSESYAYTGHSNGGNNGQVTGITDSVDSGRTVAYTYDALHRLKTAITNGSTNYPQWGLSWSYDRYGNRTAQSQTQGSPPTNSLTFATTSGAGAYTNRPDSYSHDANGNMTNDGANTLTYNSENQVLTAGGVTYVYDGGGLRVKKCTANCTSPTSTMVYVFSGSKVIAEYANGAGVTSPTKEYIYSGSALVATHESSTLKYHHADRLSMRLTTDTSGTGIATTGHYPFGESWYETGGTNKLKFTSYERDTETGNDFAMARYQVSRLGRFNRPDPIAGSTLDPQSLNRYAYTQNDPVNLTDPLGLTVADPTVVSMGSPSTQLPYSGWGNPFSWIGVQVYSDWAWRGGDSGGLMQWYMGSGFHYYGGSGGSGTKKEECTFKVAFDFGFLPNPEAQKEMLKELRRVYSSAGVGISVVGDAKDAHFTVHAAGGRHTDAPDGALGHATNDGAFVYVGELMSVQQAYGGGTGRAALGRAAGSVAAHEIGHVLYGHYGRGGAVHRPVTIGVDELHVMKASGNPFGQSLFWFPGDKNFIQSKCQEYNSKK